MKLTSIQMQQLRLLYVILKESSEKFMIRTGIDDNPATDILDRVLGSFYLYLENDEELDSDGIDMLSEILKDRDVRTREDNFYLGAQQLFEMINAADFTEDALEDFFYLIREGMSNDEII